MVSANEIVVIIANGKNNPDINFIVDAIARPTPLIEKDNPVKAIVANLAERVVPAKAVEVPLSIAINVAPLAITFVLKTLLNKENETIVIPKATVEAPNALII